jgi:8-oxo-dGTP pyrophosphatase MutT (NUDIX family)
MLRLCDVTGDPFSREHYDPGHFTASAFVLSPSRDMLLLIFHGKLHRWLQPGGHIDAEDADVLSAARREVAEEVGIDDLLEGRLLDVDVHLIPPLRGAPSHAHFDVRFLFRAPDLDHLAGSDAQDSRWFPLGEIDAVASDPSVMRAVSKLRG